MTARLVSLDGAASIPIDRTLIIVGRHERCDVHLDSPFVSVRHCCLVLDGDGLVVRDLGSSNGTRINGRRVESGRLGPGDELTIARLRFRLESITAGAAPGDPDAEGPAGADRGPRPRSSPGLVPEDHTFSTALPHTMFDMKI